MRKIARALGVWVGLLIVGVCYVIGFYDKDTCIFLRNAPDPHDNGYGN